MNRIRKKQLISIYFILSIVSIGIFNTTIHKTQSVEPFFTLVFKTNQGGVRPDYGNFLRQHLARIGINVDIYALDWPTFVSELIYWKNFDICYVAFVGSGSDPDFTGVYNENGSLNIFGYHTSMDYNETLGTGVNEWYMREGTLILPSNSPERIQHYWEWEQYLMDKILPCQPTFVPKSYTGYWANLEGYNISKGIYQSWGKMSWDGQHVGQMDDCELVVASAPWMELNPLYLGDSSSGFIADGIFDPLIWYDADMSMWPHLAKEIEIINNTHIRLHIREGIKWFDPGGYPGENFNAKDVYFSLFCWDHFSRDEMNFDWIEKVEILDDYTVDLFIDANPATDENEQYAPSLSYLAVPMLPEHYLNVTQLSDLTTPDISHPYWKTFSTNPFGTGLFTISSYIEGVETTLELNPDCWYLDESITNDPDLSWVERFGTFTGGLDTLRVRIIPTDFSAILEFKAGKIDLVGISNYPDQIDKIETDSKYDIQSETQYYIGFFGYNMRKSRAVIGNTDPCLDDPTITKGLAVRKAISYAINRVEINEVIHQGELTITDHPIYAKLGIWCNPNIIRYNFDIDKAKEYMSLAGYEVIPFNNTNGNPNAVRSIIIATSTVIGFCLIAIVTYVFVILPKRKKNN